MSWTPIQLEYTEPYNDVVSKTHWENEFKKLIDASNSVHTQVDDLSGTFDQMLASVLASVMASVNAIHSGVMHPTSAITGLDDALAAIVASVEAITAGAVQADWNEADVESLAYIVNKPALPTDLADLDDDPTHRLITDDFKTFWDAKARAWHGTAAPTDALLPSAQTGDIYIRYA